MHRQQMHLLPVGAGQQHQQAHQPMEALQGARQQQQQAPLLQSTYQEGLLQASRAHTRARSRSPVGSMALEADEVHRQLQEAARNLPAGPGSSRPGSLDRWHGSLRWEAVWMSGCFPEMVLGAEMLEIACPLPHPAQECLPRFQTKPGSLLYLAA